MIEDEGPKKVRLGESQATNVRRMMDAIGVLSRRIDRSRQDFSTPGGVAWLQSAMRTMFKKFVVEHGGLPPCAALLTNAAIDLSGRGGSTSGFLSKVGVNFLCLPQEHGIDEFFHALRHLMVDTLSAGVIYGATVYVRPEGDLWVPCREGELALGRPAIAAFFEHLTEDCASWISFADKSVDKDDPRALSDWHRFPHPPEKCVIFDKSRHEVSPNAN